MKKFIFNLIIFLFIPLIIPAVIYIVDPYNYYEHPFKMDINRMELFRRNNVANWATVEINKIDDDLKSNTKTCVIGDSRSRLMISSGHSGGWTNRICGIDLDVLDLSFGGANLDESFSLLENQIEKLNSLKTIIISVPIDRLLLQNHDVDRISSSYFGGFTSAIKYVTDINLVTNIFENRDKILKNRMVTKNDTLKTKKVEELGSIKNQNDKIRENKTDHEQIRKRNRIIAFKKERFEKTIKNRDKTIPVSKIRMVKDEKVRTSFLRKYKLSNRSLFHKNLDILKDQLSSFSNKYEIIILIPVYDDILYDSITNSYRNDYNYYVESLKKLPFEVIYLQDISNQFVFPDPVHGNFENGTLISKINHERGTLYKRH